MEQEVTITLKGRGAESLARFALGIQEALNRNKEKGGWAASSPEFLESKLTEEFVETMHSAKVFRRIVETIVRREEEGSPSIHSDATIAWGAKELGLEGFDLGAVTMMLLDIAGALESVDIGGSGGGEKNAEA